MQPHLAAAVCRLLAGTNGQLHVLHVAYHLAATSL